MRELKPESRNRIIQAFSKTDYHVEFLWGETEIQGKNRLLSVKCTLCNCIKKYYVSHLHTAKYFCDNCRNNRLKKKANELNFEYIEKIKIKDRNPKVVLECRVDKSITTVCCGHLLNNKVCCKTCLVNKYKYALSLKNCTYISQERTKGRTIITFKNEYGEIKTVGSSNLLSDSWTQSDILSSWVQKYYCYCFWFYLDNDNENLPIGLYYKIGVSNDPLRRLKSLKLTFSANIEILGEFSDRFLATENEKLLHSTNDEYKLNPETVKIFSKGLALRKVINGERRKARDGITEWFYNIKGN
jgi:hypothetical protein